MASALAHALAVADMMTARRRLADDAAQRRDIGKMRLFFRCFSPLRHGARGSVPPRRSTAGRRRSPASRAWDKALKMILFFAAFHRQVA